MKTYESILRAHHGMCLAFFKGKGYSNEFSKHMKEVKDRMEQNPVVRIIAEADCICSACPNQKEGRCTSQEKVAKYDRQVIAECGLIEGAEMPFMEFFHLVYEKILLTGKREEICGDCQWNALCFLDGKEEERNEHVDERENIRTV